MDKFKVNKDKSKRDTAEFIAKNIAEALERKTNDLGKMVKIYRLFDEFDDVKKKVVICAMISTEAEFLGIDPLEYIDDIRKATVAVKGKEI